MFVRSNFSMMLFYYFVIFAAGSMCFIPSGWANTPPADSSKYLDAVREFADNVLKYGRDTYGPKHTPLFVDGLNVNSREPVKWISPKGDWQTAAEIEEWILSNFASQQTLLRTLDGLSAITGADRRRLLRACRLQQMGGVEWYRCALSADEIMVRHLAVSCQRKPERLLGLVGLQRQELRKQRRQAASGGGGDD